MAIHSSPVVALNHAVAVAMGEGLEQGLTLIERVGSSGDLDEYHLFHSARADVLRRLGRFNEAMQAYRKALELTANKAEQNYLCRRIEELE